eukprot:COSAG05_NODE_15892_length_358_cov_1.590734_1_plen_58_part_10
MKWIRQIRHFGLSPGSPQALRISVADASVATFPSQWVEREGSGHLGRWWEMMHHDVEA